jgi:hypothetical protein
MTLLHHHQTVPKDSATIPVWSLMLPRWAATQRTESRPMREPEPATWTWAKCGTVVNAISAAVHRVDVHRTQERPRPASARHLHFRARGVRRSARSAKPPVARASSTATTCQSRSVADAKDLAMR